MQGQKHRKILRDSPPFPASREFGIRIRAGRRRKSPMSPGETTQILDWVERLRVGDDSAMGELLVHFEARLCKLTRKMLRTFPAVRRWEQTDDVFQGAAMRLRRALKEVTPKSTREFFGLAA